MATTTNFGWETPDDTDLVKDGAAAIRTLGQSIDTSMMDLEGGTTGQVLSKASNTDMDFTWVTTDDTNAIQNAIVDAKGDLIAATAADTPARLAVGTNGQILTADSTAATGLAWATPASSGGMTLISETVASALSSLSFSSISGTYKQLYLVWTGITHSATGSVFSIRLNNNSTASTYQSQGFTAKNETFDNNNFDATSLETRGNLAPFGTSVTFGGSSCSKGYLMIDNYASSTKFKAYDLSFTSYNVATSQTNGANVTGFFSSTSAITSIDIVRLSGTATFSNASNTTIRLYGVS